MNFEQFLTIFELKASACFDKTELMAIFKLLSQEYEVDNKIKVSKVEEVLSEMEIMDIEIADLVIILKNKAVDGYVNYKEFIDETF